MKPFDDMHSPRMNALRENALKQLQSMQSQGKTLITVKSNLDLLMARYDVGKGLFSRAADWYGARPWWVKIILGVMTIALAIGLGLLIHMPFALGFSVSGLYLFLSYLFINHYTITQKRTRRLCEDVLEMERTLNDSVVHFQSLSDGLKKTMLALCELNAQMTEHLETLDTQNQRFQQQVSDYEKTIQSLIQTKTIFYEQIEKLKQQLHDADALFQVTHQTLLSESESLALTTKCLSTTTQDFEKNDMALKDAVDELHQTTHQIEQCYEAFQPILVSLSERMAQHSDRESCTNDALRLEQVPEDLSRFDTLLFETQSLIQQHIDMRESSFKQDEHESKRNRAKQMIQRAQHVLVYHSINCTPTVI